MSTYITGSPAFKGDSIIGSTIEPIIKGKQGLAILVTCDYEGSTNPLPGTNTDASEMVKTIEELEYGMIQLQNKTATKHNIWSEIRRVCRDMHLLEDKILMFIFSGHGHTGDRILTDDWKFISVKEITKTLLANRTRVDMNVKPPVLFLIDACRGPDYLKSGPDQAKSDDISAKGLIEEEANFRLDYATLDYHVSYISGSGGSRWLPIVARDLRNERNKSFQSIMSDVQKKVWEQFTVRQQPQIDDRLNTGELFLHPNPIPQQPKCKSKQW